MPFLFTLLVSTHSRLKAAGSGKFADADIRMVSTHSRLKAAGKCLCSYRPLPAGFNTQPPKGGWAKRSSRRLAAFPSFNTQPPKGGWADNYDVLRLVIEFQHTAA